MTSLAKIDSNKRNALMSTGPRSREGKEKSRFNAVSHGLTATTPVLPHESREDYDELVAALRDELLPVGVLEELLVARVAARIFRLARMTRIETGVLVWELHGDDSELGSAGHTTRSLYGLLLDLSAANDEVSNARAHDAEKARSSELARLGRAFIRDSSGADALTKLSRYEATLDRALFRDLAELYRLKECRLQASATRSSE